MEGVEKTRLLRVMANYFAMKYSPDEVVFLEAMELAEELRTAKKRKDMFLWALKKKYRNLDVIREVE